MAPRIMVDEEIISHSFRIKNFLLFHFVFGLGFLRDVVRTAAWVGTSMGTSNVAYI